jgi:hypothetical protein
MWTYYYVQFMGWILASGAGLNLKFPSKLILGLNEVLVEFRDCNIKFILHFHDFELASLNIPVQISPTINMLTDDQVSPFKYREAQCTLQLLFLQYISNQKKGALV